MDARPGTGGGCLCVWRELGRAERPGPHIAQIPGWGRCLESTGSGCGPWISASQDLCAVKPSGSHTFSFLQSPCTLQEKEKAIFLLARLAFWLHVLNQLTAPVGGGGKSETPDQRLCGL